MPPESFHITVQGTGAQFPCRRDETVLAAMLRARCGPVHHGCCGGGCGVCRARVVNGMYRIDKRMSRAHVNQRQQEEGQVLLCCIRACSNMVITTPKAEMTNIKKEENNGF